MRLLAAVAASQFCFLSVATAQAPQDGIPPEAREKIRDKADMSFDEMGTGEGLDPTSRHAVLALQFLDAVSARPVPGAEVEFAGRRVQTNDRGIARFPFPNVPVDKDVTLYAVVHKTGQLLRRGFDLPESARAYADAKLPVQFTIGTVFFNRYALSPKMAPGKVRFVLEWSDTPPDLDAHLVKPGSFHISFQNMRSFEDKVFLDHDAQTGFGPETITVESVDPAARYTFFVHDWTDRNNPGADALSRSKARVMVYDSNTLIGVYFVPAGAGTAWHVVELVGGTLAPTNRMLPVAPSGG